MKKTLLSFAILAMASFTQAIAQPTITSATNAPVAGDVFYNYYADTNGVDKGAAGANVIWDMTRLVRNDSDTTYFFGCPGSTYCDSFATVNLLSSGGQDTTFYNSTTTGLYAIGSYDFAGDTLYRFGDDSEKFFSFPLSYGTTISDTSTYSGGPLTVTSYNYSTGDAYGSLKLPAGVFKNVLRVRTVDSTIGEIGGITLFSNIRESYTWYVPGFHAPLLTVGYDTAGTGTPYVSYVVYITGTGYSPSVSALATKSIAKSSPFSISPNPATSVVNFRFELGTTAAASLTVSDVAGRIVTTIPAADLKEGANYISFPVSQLAGGMYIVRLQAADGVQTHRFVVTK